MEKITKLFAGGILITFIVKLFYITLVMIGLLLCYRIYRNVRYGFNYQDPDSKWG